MQTIATLCAWNWCSGLVEPLVISQTKMLPFSWLAMTEEISVTRHVTGEALAMDLMGWHLLPPPAPCHLDVTSKRTLRNRLSSSISESSGPACVSVTSRLEGGVARFPARLRIADLPAFAKRNLARRDALPGGSGSGISCGSAEVLRSSKGSSRTTSEVAPTLDPEVAACIGSRGTTEGTRIFRTRDCNEPDTASVDWAAHTSLRICESEAAAIASGGSSKARGSEFRTSKSMYQLGRAATRLLTSLPGSSRRCSQSHSGSSRFPEAGFERASPTKCRSILSVG
mmetsp:Transcript_84730/g.168268  ORF Transcript_84730/g.168268 Transcript_84730/m.168268 type:complete len:284 (-) Transcript_84730:194-1045(-)